MQNIPDDIRLKIAQEIFYSCFNHESFNFSKKGVWEKANPVQREAAFVQADAAIRILAENGYI